MGTSEINNQFHSRLATCKVFSEPLGEGKWWEFWQNAKLFVNFKSIPFDYPLISWVTNQAYSYGF